MPGPHFTPKLFAFLRELEENNTRAWFEANRERYEADVRGPMLRFIADVGPGLRKISRHITADPRPVGGSLFRIHRDVRFSKDKSPYKTHVGAQFRHEAGSDAHAPMFYLHLATSEIFCGTGIWHPDGPTLAAVRGAIVDDPAAWKRATGAKAFRARHRLGGDSLSRPPRGIDPEHPLVEDLKRKDFVSIESFTRKDACAAGFLDRYVESCAIAAPFVRFLCRATGVPF